LSTQYFGGGVNCTPWKRLGIVHLLHLLETEISVSQIFICCIFIQLSIFLNFVFWYVLESQI
jgi:hypothetical protein